MKIVVSCWALREKRLDGIGNFLVETIKRIIADHPEIDFHLLCDKGFAEDYFDFPNANIIFFFPALRHPVLYVAYLEFALPGFLKKIKPALFVGPEGFLSLRSHCKQVPVIHDLNFEHNPLDNKLQNRIYYRTFFKRFAKKASRVVTVSEYSKKDISSLYKIPSSKIDVVGNGSKKEFKVLSDAEKAIVKQKFTNGDDYFFFVGSMHPRKNITRLMEAFDKFKNTNDNKIKLVLSGNILWDSKYIADVFDKMAHKTEIIFTGRVEDAELFKLMGAALCLTFVPTFEGFGIPIIEAFNAGVPVICSNTTAMPEIAGNAAVLVDPFAVDAISEAMHKISSDTNFRNDLIQKGFIQKEKYSWEKSAALLFESMMKAIKN